MSVQHTIKESWTNGLTTISAEISQAGTTETNFDATVADGSTDVAATYALTIGALQSFYLLSNQNLTIKTNSPGTNAVQAVTMTGSPTGGTFTATGTRPDTLAVNTATAIPYNATVAQMQTAMNTIYGSGNTVVSGTDGGPWVVSFQGTAAAYPVVDLTFDNSGLTGGTSPAASAGTTTTGVRWGDKFTLKASVPIAWHKDSFFANPLTADVTGLYVTNSSGATAKLQIRAINN